MVNMSHAIARRPEPAGPRTRLLGEPRRTAQGGWAAPLLIPEGDAFFFDHPLDHVSGMLSICGLLDLVDAATEGRLECSGRRLVTELSFPSMGGLDRPTELIVAPDGLADGLWFVRSAQGGAPICEGWMEISGTPAPVVLDRARTLPDDRCPADLVHRTRADNVLLGPPVEDEDGIVAPLLRPGAGHYLAGYGRHGFSARGVIEAGRQFLTLLVHRAAGKPLDTQIVWLSFGADLPCAPPTDVALSLRWRRVPLRGSRIPLSFELVCSSSTAAVASFRHEVLTASPSAYQRYRRPGV
jgi:A-factor biosynthesis hotdog domain